MPASRLCWSPLILQIFAPAFSLLRKRFRVSIFYLITTLLLASCQSSISDRPSNEQDTANNASIESLLRAADTADSISGAQYRLRAIDLLIINHDLSRAKLELDRLPSPEALPANLQSLLAITGARLALASSNPKEANIWLAIVSPDALEELSSSERIEFLIMVAETHNALANSEQAANILLGSDIDESALAKELTQRLSDITWSTLNNLSIPQLDSLALNDPSYNARGWVELNRSVRSDDFSLRGQLDAIARWQRVWTQHFAASYLPQALLGIAAEWDRRPRHIALILPLQQAAGRALQEGFVAAYYQSLAISREVPRISLIDSSGANDAHYLYDEAVALGADLIVGPLDKALVNELAQFSQLPVLTLALNYLDSNIEASNDIIQFGLAPEDEINQIINLAKERNFERAAVVTPEDSNYVRLSEEFRSRWEAVGGDVVTQRTFGNNDDFSAVVKGLLAIDASEDRARRLRATLPRNNIEFTPQRRTDIDFVFLIANPRQGRQLVPTLAFYYAQDLPLYALPSIYDGASESNTRDLDGLIFNDGPWMVAPNELRNAVDASLEPALGASQRLRAMGVDSFYLAMQLKQLQENPNKKLQGVTGALQLQEAGRVSRELLTVRFEDGKPKAFQQPTR